MAFALTLNDHKPKDDMRCAEGHDQYNEGASSSFVCDKWIPKY